MTAVLRGVAAGLVALGLGACAAPVPTGPSVVALPPAGKDFQRFREEDAFCRQEAFQSIGGAGAEQERRARAAGTAALATGIGAGAGALIGAATGHAGGGAAIGAGLGLAGGSLAGAGQAQAARGDLQRAFDITYMQCMAAKGNTIQEPPRIVRVPVPVADPFWGPRVGFGRPWMWYGW